MERDSGGVGLCAGASPTALRPTSHHEHVPLRREDQSCQEGHRRVTATQYHSGDHCWQQPAPATRLVSCHTRGAITVAASMRQDRAWSMSNAGLCVDIFAPGEQIPSSHKDCNECIDFKSGTSMAAPHVTGAIAPIAGAMPQHATMEGETPPRATHGSQEPTQHVRHHQETQTDNSQSFAQPAPQSVLIALLALSPSSQHLTPSPSLTYAPYLPHFKY